MKKLTCILLTIAMLLGIYAIAESDAPSGMWYLHTLAQGEQVYNVSEIGMEMTINLKDDGTAVITTTGEDDSTGTWAATESGVAITVDDDTQDATLTDGKLVISTGDSEMVFGREALEGFNPGNPIEAASIDAFNGNWHSTMVDAMGMVISSELAEMDITMLIENGSVTINGSFDILGSDEDASAEPIVVAGALENGTMTISGSGLDGAIIKLYDSGLLSIEMAFIGDEALRVYFAFAE